MATKLRDLAKLVDGQLVGDGELEIEGAAPLSDVRAGQITLVDHAKALAQLSASPAAAVLAPRNVHPPHLPVIHVDHLHRAFIQVFQHFQPPQPQRQHGISPAAHISPSARLGQDVTIYPGATIGEEVTIGDRAVIHAGVQILEGCQIGEDVVLFANVVLYEKTTVGARSVVHAGAVLGAYGFGYETKEGRHLRTAQLGNVQIAADVEIGANTTIDRGTYGPTIIGEGTKIDNQVMIAHNCRIGRYNIICSQVGIAGSCTTGDYVVMAGQVGIADHVHIGHRVTLGAKAGVMHDIPAEGVYVGIPATPARDQMVKQAALAKLPEMRKQLKSLQQVVERLTGARRTDAA